MMHADVSTGTQPSQFIARGIVPKKNLALYAAIFGIFCEPGTD
jgi:hypothetical protein